MATASLRTCLTTPLMVIGDFHVVRVAVLPDEANAELIVNPNAVLALTVALQRFQPVARRRLEIVECVGRMHHSKFAERDALDRLKPLRELAVPDLFSICASKALNHI